MPQTKYIILNAAINPQLVDKVKQVIAESLNTGFEELYFLISSGGGDVGSGLSLAAVIKSLSIKTTMHNISTVDSVANVVFSAATERYATNNSSFLFHGIQLNFKDAHFTSSQLDEQLQVAIRMEEDIAKNVASNIDSKFETIKELINRAKKVVSVEEAKQLGIIHDIKDAKIPKGVQVVSIGNT